MASVAPVTNRPRLSRSRRCTTSSQTWIAPWWKSTPWRRMGRGTSLLQTQRCGGKGWERGGRMGGEGLGVEVWVEQDRLVSAAVVACTPSLHSPHACARTSPGEPFTLLFPTPSRSALLSITPGYTHTHTQSLGRSESTTRPSSHTLTSPPPPCLLFLPPTPICLTVTPTPHPSSPSLVAGRLRRQRRLPPASHLLAARHHPGRSARGDIPHSNPHPNSNSKPNP
jgi:hypothetical protein